MMVNTKIPAKKYSDYWPQVSLDRPEVRYDLDLEYHGLYDVALAATQMRDRPMRRQRHYLLRQLIEQLGNVPGDAVEVGCFRGLSAYVACASFLAIEKRLNFHIFDSFEGLSPPVVEDQSQYLPTAKPESGNPFACSEEQVRANLKDFSFIKYHKGWVPDGFEQVQADRFCFVHVDVDLYEPTRDVIAFFWPRLSPGGVVVLDDYGTLFYPGARQALTQYLKGRSDVLIVETTSGSAVAVKLYA